MSDPEARKRILDLLAAGRISVDAATDLLKAIGAPGAADRVEGSARPRGTARLLRVLVDAPGDNGQQGVKVRLNIPLGLAKYAARFIPPDATAELSLQGIDLAKILADIGDDVPDGRLLDVEADGDDGKVSVVVEVA